VPASRAGGLGTARRCSCAIAGPPVGPSRDRRTGNKASFVSLHSCRHVLRQRPAGRRGGHRGAVTFSARPCSVGAARRAVLTSDRRSVRAFGSERGALSPAAQASRRSSVGTAAHAVVVRLPLCGITPGVGAGRAGPRRRLVRSGLSVGGREAVASIHARARGRAKRSRVRPRRSRPPGHASRGGACARQRGPRRGRRGRA
jgi:hypothetical protein